MLQEDLERLHLPHEMPYTGGPALRGYEPHTAVRPANAYLQTPGDSTAPDEALPHTPRQEQTPASSHQPSPVRKPSHPRHPSPSLQALSINHLSPHSSPRPTSRIDSDIEKGRLKPPAPARISRRGTPDPEKAAQDHRSMRSCPSNAHSHHSTTIYEEEEDEEDGNNGPNEHAVWILTYLSTLAPILSAFFTLYTLLASITIILLSPLCFCTTRQPLRTHFAGFLVPPLNLQLRLIYSLYDITETTSPSSIPMLILVNVFAPVVAVGVAVAAWVAASFWVFAKILGNPGGKDERNDGRAAVLGVRGFWEAFLVRGLR